MGIKTKIFAGFIIVGTLLFLSGIIAIYELTSIENSMQGLLKDNLKSIEVSKQMLKASHQINQGVLKAINGQGEDASRLIVSGERYFKSSYTVALNNITVKGEDRLVRSIDSCYRSFRVLADSATLSTAPRTPEWYFGQFVVVHDSLNEAIDELISINQKSLYENAKMMEVGANRAIMPGLIAIGVGIIFIVLFNYFVNLYFIQPIVKITQGVENYVKHSIPFKVKVDTQDEVGLLRSSIEKLIAQNKTNKIEE